MKNGYLTPVRQEQVEIEIKKSRFIACSRLVINRDQAMSFLQELKTRYPDARHHCWAYLIGNPLSASNAAMNDDGEPSGTAGKPILNVIQHKKIGDIMVIVVRYFGGIKLGAGGLTRAYSSATENLLSKIKLTERVSMCSARLRLDFSVENQVRHWLENNGGEIVSIEYRSEVQMGVSLPLDRLEALVAFCQSKGIAVDQQ